MPSNIGNNPDEMGGVLPSKLEQATFEKDLYSQRITDIPTNLQMQCDYDVRTDGQPVYLGFAPRGLATTVEGWLIHKFTYDVSDRVVTRTIAYDKWSVRATTAVYA